MGWKKKEEITRDEYCNIISNPFYNTESLLNIIIHENFEMKDFGLLVYLEKPWLGVSPDVVTYCNCCEYETVEIKCPYSL